MRWLPRLPCSCVFCAACGCYSAERSKGLKLVCKRFPTKAGKEALAAIHTGNRPNKSCMDKYKRMGKNTWQEKYRSSSEKAPSPVGSQPVAASAAADVAPLVAIVPRARSRSRERILKREGKPNRATISLHDGLKLVGLNANSQKQPGGNNPGSAKFLLSNLPWESVQAVRVAPIPKSLLRLVELAGMLRLFLLPPLSWHAPGIGGEVGQSWIPAKPASTLQWVWT